MRLLRPWDSPITLPRPRRLRRRRSPPLFQRPPRSLLLRFLSSELTAKQFRKLKMLFKPWTTPKSFPRCHFWSRSGLLPHARDFFFSKRFSKVSKMVSSLGGLQFCCRSPTPLLCNQPTPIAYRPFRSQRPLTCPTRLWKEVRCPWRPPQEAPSSGNDASACARRSDLSCQRKFAVFVAEHQEHWWDGGVALALCPTHTCD